MGPKNATPSDPTKWPAAILATFLVVAIVVSAVGLEGKQSHNEDISNTRVYADSLSRAQSEAQAAINNEILKKLDCAIWQLPKNCRDTMSPRGGQ